MSGRIEISDPDLRRRAVADCLEIDRVTAEVVEALEAGTVRAILLKGPSIASWLYGPGELRAYADTDLVVSPDKLAHARHVLGGLGFKATALGVHGNPEVWPRHDVWTRAGRSIDLNCTIDEAEAKDATVWTALLPETEPAHIGGREITILNTRARALIVALHAAHHRERSDWPLADLERALRLLPPSLWSEVAELAGRVGALAPMVKGLELAPGGPAVVSRLGLEHETSLNAELRVVGFPDLTTKVSRVVRAPTRKAKGALLLLELIPSRSFMRIASPLARRGSAGLACAYLFRLGRPLVRAGPVLLRFYLARRAASRSHGVTG